MSDSDDTDYLLLIPPNFFWVHDDHEEEFNLNNKSLVDREIVDDLVSQVTSLENRVSAIETFENSLVADLEKLSNISSPRSFISLTKNKDEDVLKWVSSIDKDKEKSTFVYEQTDNSNKAFTMSSPFKDHSLESKDGKKLELTEVDRLLKEMESTQRDIENKLRQREKEFMPEDSNLNREKAKSIPLLGDNIGSVPDLGFGVRQMFNDSPKKNGESPTKRPVVEPPCIRRSMSLLGSSAEDETDKYKSYLSHEYNALPSRSYDTPGKSSSISVRRKLSMASQESTKDGSYLEKLASPLKSAVSSPARFTDRFNGKGSSSPSESNYSTRTVILAGNKGSGDGPTAGDTGYSRASQSYPPQPPGVSDKLLSLNELWKSDDDTISRNPLKLKQKLEEERYRRLHLENTVQALQKKVLEEQEKLAVAIQVDEKKDLVIEKLTEAWKKMVEHWKQIEDQRHSASQALLTEKAMSKRSQEEINKRIVRWEKEVSQALDLAAGFKTKAEGLERELAGIRDEYNLKLQESEGRIADAELNTRQKEKERRELEERLDEVLHQLHEERKSYDDVKHDFERLEDTNNRNEAELSVLKEQRDLLSLRLKEETSRIKLLEQQKLSLESSLAESAAKQKEAEEKFKVANKHLETVKSDLKDLYQKQLENVVREKLSEFQSQLEQARDDMRQELNTELSAARESSRRHQQALVNSHVAEMRRLESIHKEEMASLERRLAEAESRSTKLEMAKRDIAHKLHKVMENQWQQALGIITGDLTLRQGESDFEGGHHSHGRGDDLTQTIDQESPCKEPKQPSNPTMLKYIEMMLDKHPGRPTDTLDSSAFHDSTSEFLDESSLHPLNWNNRLKTGNEVDKDGKKPPWK